MKKKSELPEVRIHGDLQDVKALVAGVNKKKSIVIFKDGDMGTLYLEVEGKFRPVSDEDYAFLNKKYRLICFSFFPSLKPAEPDVAEPESELPTPIEKEPKTGKKRDKQVKKEKKEKKNKKKKN